MSRYLMGIDNGGSVSKVGVYDLEGKEIAISGSKSEVSMPSPGRYERDMDQIWDANVTAIANVLKKSGISGDQIEGIAITGHGNGLYLIDENGRPTYPAIQSADSRATEFVEKWIADGTFDKVHPKTLQCLWPASTAVLLAWMKKYEPDVLNKTRWALFIKDYLRYKLTGEVYIELTDISGSNLLNNVEIAYDKSLLEQFGIDDLLHILPPVKKSADICGFITKDVAAITGLKEGTPVAGGMFDIDAAGLATGINDETKLNIIVGSWSNNQYISKTPNVSKDIFMTSLYSIPGYWLVLEGSATSASNLEWFVDNFMKEETIKAKKEGTTVYRICDKSVENTKPSDAGIVFVPFLYGSNAGLKAKSVFVGLEGWHTREHVIRSIFEGIVFSHKTHIDKLMQFMDQPKVIRMAGGAVRSDVWMQMFADVLQTPIEITAAVELGTLGAAMCAGVAVGAFSSYDHAMSSMIKVTKRVSPTPAFYNIYQSKYEKYQSVITALSDYWSK